MIWPSEFLEQFRNTPDLFSGHEIMSSVLFWFVLSILVSIQSLKTVKHVWSVAAIVPHFAFGYTLGYRQHWYGKTVHVFVRSHIWIKKTYRRALVQVQTLVVLYNSVENQLILMNEPHLADICYCDGILSKAKDYHICHMKMMLMKGILCLLFCLTKDKYLVNFNFNRFNPWK